MYREGPHGPEVALASRRTKRGDLAWGLPKGLIERGEDPAETTLVLKEGNELEKLTDLDKAFRPKEGAHFVVYHNSPTPVS